MIVIMTHGWVHRMRADGIMESGKSVAGNAINFVKFEQRTPESMDMSGGDYDFIYQSLVRLVEIFRNRIEPLPRSTPTVQNQPLGERVE